MIFKNKKHNYKTKELELIKKNYFFVEGLANWKVISLIAEENGLTNTNANVKLSRFYDALEKIEPKIKDYYNVDVYLDLSRIFKKEWIGIIGKLMARRNSSLYFPSEPGYVIINKKVFTISGKEIGKYITRDFFATLRELIPVSVNALADKLNMDAEKYEEFLDIVYHDKISIMNGIILSTRASGLSSMFLYLKTVKRKPSLRDTFDRFKLKYPNNFNGKNFSTFEKFIALLEKEKVAYKDIIERKEDGSFEVIGFKKESNK